MKLVISLLFSIFTCDLFAQLSDTSILYRAEVKKFFTDIRTQELSEGEIVIVDRPVFIESSHISYYSSRDNELSGFGDSSFIIKQIDQFKNCLWDSTLIANSVFVKEDTINKIFKNSKEGSGWLAFYSKFGKWKDFYRISIPIFSKDLTSCIVEINYHCGSLCGTYCVLVFRLVDNCWKKVNELECSVS